MLATSRLQAASYSCMQVMRDLRECPPAPPTEGAELLGCSGRVPSKMKSSASTPNATGGCF